jgi:phosphoribosylformylglycinamidine synthase
MDLKEAGSRFFLAGTTREEMGGSHYHLARGRQGGAPPQVEFTLGLLIFQGLHRAMQKGLVRACHDLSEGGLAVALAEMAFAGGVGADIDLAALAVHGLADEVLLFSESTSRFVLEVRSSDVDALHGCFEGSVPVFEIGKTCEESRLRIRGLHAELISARLDALKEAWQKPLRW